VSFARAFFDATGFMTSRCVFALALHYYDQSSAWPQAFGKFDRARFLPQM